MHLFFYNQSFIHCYTINTLIVFLLSNSFSEYQSTYPDITDKMFKIKKYVDLILFCSKKNACNYLYFWIISWLR